MANNITSFFNYGDGSGTISNGQVSDFLNQEETKYRVFTGADLTAYIGNIRIGKLQGITYSVTRETMPIYTTGDPNCKAFSKGKRGIAGTMVFTQFDRHAILRDLVNTKTLQLQNLWGGLNVPGFGTAALSPSIQNVPANSPNVNFSDLIAQTAGVAQRDVLETAFLVAQRAINYVDQIPPFDVTITFVNEAGNAAVFSIHGCQLVNEGGGWTLDDLHSETAYTFLARAITPLVNIGDAATLGTGLTPGTLGGVLS